MLSFARHLSSSIARAAPAQLPKSTASLAAAPTGAAPDVDVPPPEHVRLELTDRAANQLRAIAQRPNVGATAGLRIAVESGGCHGYQYSMELASGRNAEDYHFTHPAISPSNVYVDAISLGLLNGSTVDYASELIGSSFRISGNPQAKGGCGCGISWEMKD